MEDDSEPLHPDPEIAALLDFEPVVQKMPRADGWTAERQRTFIAVLAETGCQETAAQAAGMTARGAYSLRKYVDGEGFAAAWAGAVALHKRRRAERGGALARPGGARRPAGTRSRPRTQEEIEDEARDRLKFLEDLLDRYRRKLKHERICRLAGRIVEADFYVRQLTMIELLLDIGGEGDRLRDWFGSGAIDEFRLVATPVSAFLARVRRDYWREKGEPDRMPGPLIGEHDQYGAHAPRDGRTYYPGVDGDFDAWKARNERIDALQAEAQLEWEEKAKADAEAWAALVKRAEGGGAQPSEGAEP